MAQNALDRLWNRLVARYESDDDADCCGPSIEEVRADPESGDADDGCE